MTDGIENSSFSRKIPEDTYYRQKGDLQHYADQLQATISYAVPSPKEYTHTFLAIAILTHMEEQGVLQKREAEKITEEFRMLQEGIYDGSVKIPKVARLIDALVQDMKSHNRKAELIASIIELEHLVCVDPPQGQKPRSDVEFNEYVDPIFRALRHPVPPSLIKKLLEEIQEITFFLTERGEMKEALDKLEKCRNLVIKNPDL